jgi:WD40 repeat protein
MAAQAADAGALAGATENTLASNVHSIVNTGHRGTVFDLQYDQRRNLLFSAAEDGTVRIWDTHEGILYRSLRVTRLSARMIAIDPVAPRVAVVVSDGLSSVSLSVWDWEQEKQLLRVPLRDAPLFLRFSGQGSFLVYGESSWQSLKILDSSTGSPLQFHPEGFGIVAFAEMSRSEKTIMTYQVSGRISYWDLASGGLSLDIPTTPYLSHIRISRDRRYIVGTTGREVVLVDTLSGAVRGRAAITSDACLDISGEGDRIAAVPTAGGSPTEWSVSSDSLIGVHLSVKADPGGNSGEAYQVLCYGTDGLYLAGSSGVVSELSSSGNLHVIGRNVLADITGIDARHGFLALGSRDWIRVFRSDLLEGSQSPSYIHSFLIENPWKSSVGLLFISNASLLAWSKDDNAPRFAVLDLPDSAFTLRSAGDPQPTPRFRTLPSGFRSPLADLALAGTSLLGVENGGTIRVVDLATGVSHFEVRVPALSAVVAASSTELIGGKNTALASGGSLVRINIRTGETVGIPGRNVFTWDLAFDPSAPGAGGPALYSLGVDASGATNLLLHDGSGFERETVIATDQEEVLDASLALDPSTHVLYAALGQARIVSWNGGKATIIPAEYASLRGFLACEGLLFSLDRDSVLSIADQSSGSRVGELSLFSDGEWAATVPGGGYLASPGGDSHVRVFVNGTSVRATEDYRLRAESW